MLNEFGFCGLVVFAGEEPRNRIEDILEVLRFPLGKVGIQGDVEGWIPSIDKFFLKLH